MREPTDSKKVTAVRTFADDAERARMQRGMPSQKKPTPAAPAHAGPVHTLPPVSVSIPKAAVRRDEPPQEFVENPPFHFIRSSSVDDTTLTTKDAITEVKRTPVEPPPVSKPVNTFTADIEKVINEHASPVLPKKDRVFDSEERGSSLEEGTIVTDRKRDRFRLFPAIFAALKEWFGEKKEEIEEAQKPKHTVTKAKKRAKVIQAAAASSVHAPRDDHKEVTKRLQYTPRITDLEEIQIKDATAIPEASWTYTTEEPGNTKTEQARVSLEKEISDSEEPPVPISTSISTEKEIPPAIQQKSSRPEVPPAHAISTPPPVLKEQRPVIPQPVPQKPGPVMRTQSQPEPQPEVQTTPIVSPVGEDTHEAREGRPEPQTSFWEERARKVAFFVQNFLGDKIRVAVATGVLAIIVVGGAFLWWSFATDPEPLLTTNEPTSLINASARTEVPLSSDKSQFIAALLREVEKNGTGILELHATVEHDAAIPQLVFETLRFNAPGTLVRNIRTMSFGAYQKKPFLLLRTSSFDAGLSGMLEWEHTLLIELAPLFGVPDTVTAHDARIAAYDIRTLTDSASTTRMVYGFANPHVILIAPDEVVFAALLPHIY